MSYKFKDKSDMLFNNSLVNIYICLYINPVEYIVIDKIFCLCAHVFKIRLIIPIVPFLLLT